MLFTFRDIKSYHKLNKCCEWMGMTHRHTHTKKRAKKVGFPDLKYNYGSD